MTEKRTTPLAALASGESPFSLLFSARPFVPGQSLSAMQTGEAAGAPTNASAELAQHASMHVSRKEVDSST